jgi:hypothetical protein
MDCGEGVRAALTRSLRIPSLTPSHATNPSYAVPSQRVVAFDSGCRFANRFEGGAASPGQRPHSQRVGSELRSSHPTQMCRRWRRLERRQRAPPLFPGLDFSMRIALEARRSLLVGQLLTESLVLATAGSLLGLAIAGSVVKALRASFRPPCLNAAVAISRSMGRR